MPTSQSDLRVYGEDGQLEALVEVKGSPSADEDWATELRRYIFAHGPTRKPKYYLLVSPSNVFIWGDIKEPLTPIRPDHALDLRSLLGPAFPSSKTRVYEATLELAVAAWLNRLTYGQVENTPEYEKLRQIGFLDAVRNGRIEAPSIQ